MLKRQTDKSQDDNISQEDDPMMLLRIEFSLGGGSFEINREEIIYALEHPKTQMTAIAVLTLLHYFVDKKTFFKGMKKTAKDINKTMQSVDQYLAMAENFRGSVH